MNISIAKKAKRIIQKKCHNGKGHIIFRELFNKKNFRSKLSFLHETIIPPKSTIGYHEHIDNEEIYYIISGKGLMEVDGKVKTVTSGDAVITHGGSKHGLINNSSKNLHIIVFEASY